MANIFAIVATTIDGKIARPGGAGGSDFTSPEDKAFMRSKLADTDLIVVGRATYEQYQKPLGKRRCLVFTSSVEHVKQQSDNLTYFNPQGADLQSYIDKQGYQKICVLGGSQVYTYFLKHRLLSDLFLTIEPLVFGDGMPLFNEAVEDQQWNLVKMQKLNEQGAVWLHYKQNPEF